jgi:formylglycine-generating enzyme required for sulfatase activity
MAAHAPREKEPFLLGQQLSELTATDPERVKALVCHTADRRELPAERGQPNDWRAIGRDAVVSTAGGPTPWPRVGLVCDAGLGKTTNMAWLRYRLCQREFRGRLPFLIRLDDRDDLDRVERARDRPDVLLERLACLVGQHGGVDPEVVRPTLERMRRDGRITLLFDGLDHALARRHFPKTLAEVVGSAHWRPCPVWVAGRPYAFKDSWAELFQGKGWKFLQVEPLGVAEVKRYMERTTARVWYDEFPGKPLLHIPRLLKLVCGIAWSGAAVALLETLRTPADVYHLAYFRYDAAEFGNPDAQGLLYQGIEKGEAAEVSRIGLYDARRVPTHENIEERIRRSGELLGAIAFTLLDRLRDQPNPEPETGGVPTADIKGHVIDRLTAAGCGGVVEYEHDIVRLETMNTRHLEFLLFRELSGKRCQFFDRTVLAFFAAHWACRHREDVRRWAGVEAFDEFWQFAAEFPDELVTADRWHELFGPQYGHARRRGWLEQLWDRIRSTTAGNRAQYDRVQWTRRMIYHSFVAMQRRFPATVTRWQAPAAVMKTIQAGLQDIPAGTCYYGDELVERPVEAFRLHRTPVTNAQYELFDPEHKHEREFKGRVSAAEMAMHPVVNVTFWDAWCFAAWCGCRLPTELEWEHACRAGTTTRWYFGGADRESELEKHAWYDANSGGMTHPVGERPDEHCEHPYKLCDLYGNVWEWCDSLWEASGSFRVGRGGSWGGTARSCRSAFRSGSGPEDRFRHRGFRLAAVPSGRPGE